MVTCVKIVEEVSRYTTQVGFGGFSFKTRSDKFVGFRLKTSGRIISCGSTWHQWRTCVEAKHLCEGIVAVPNKEFNILGPLCP